MIKCHQQISVRATAKQSGDCEGGEKAVGEGNKGSEEGRRLDQLSFQSRSTIDAILPSAKSSAGSTGSKV